MLGELSSYFKLSCMSEVHEDALGCGSVRIVIMWFSRTPRAGQTCRPY